MHTYSDDWSRDDDTHWHACTDTGYETLKADEAAHTFEDWTVVTAATYDAAGSEKCVCSVCGKETTREIPQLVHNEIYTVVYDLDGGTLPSEYSNTTTVVWGTTLDFPLPTKP